MPIDTSIYNNIQQPKIQNPFEIAQGAAQIQGLQQQNRLADLTYGQQLQDVQSQNALASLLTQGKTGNDVIQGMAARGYGKQALNYGKTYLDQQKTQADIGHVNAQTNQASATAQSKQVDTAKTVNGLMGSAFYAISQNPTYENSVTVMNDLKSKLPPEIAAKIDVTKIPQDPEIIKRDAMTHYLSSIDADKQMQNQTSIANNAANNATTRRGQDMTNARAREATAATMSKPFEVTGADGNPVLVQQDKQGNITPVQGYSPKASDKPLTDGQSKALLFGSRMREADKILGSLAKEGTETSVPGSRAPIIGGIINSLSSDNKQMLDQAKRDFINATLRRESGAVISDGEFANGDKQYFPQIGDSEKVKAQKAANRQLAMRGVLMEVPAKQRDSQQAQPVTKSGATVSNW